MTEARTVRDATIRALLARVPEMTAAQRQRQRASFARGNVKAPEAEIFQGGPPPPVAGSDP